MKTSIQIPQPTMPDIKRFNAKTKRLDNGCVIWMASKEKRGYGRFFMQGHVYFAHRVSYVIAHGKIDPDLVVDHLCFNKSCVNPDHLQLVTAQQNSENRQSRVSKNYSRTRGVYWRPHINRWTVQVGHNGHTYYGGNYERLKDAKQAVIDLRHRIMTNNLKDRGLSTEDLHPVTVITRKPAVQLDKTSVVTDTSQ
jgi:hypothetical protein